MPPPITVVAGPEALSEFRQGLTGERALQWLKESEGRLLITLPVGVGKTELLVKTVIHLRMVDRRYDLIVVLVPRWDILREILRKLPPDLSHVTLEPRPRPRCGDLNALGRVPRLPAAACWPGTSCAASAPGQRDPPGQGGPPRGDSTAPRWSSPRNSISPSTRGLWAGSAIRPGPSGSWS